MSKFRIDLTVNIIVSARPVVPQIHISAASHGGTPMT
jgi:hypothetical protein